MSSRVHYREPILSFSHKTATVAPVIPTVCLVYLAVHVSLYLVMTSRACYTLPEEMHTYASSNASAIENILNISHLIVLFLQSFEGCIFLGICFSLMLWSVWLWVSSCKTCEPIDRCGYMRCGYIVKLYVPHWEWVRLDVSLLPAFASHTTVLLLILSMFVSSIIGVYGTSVVAQKSHELSLLSDDEVFELEVLSDGRPHQKGYMYEANALYWQRGCIHSAHIDVKSKDKLSLGDHVLVRGKIKPYGIDEPRRLSIGIVGKISVRYIEQLSYPSSMNMLMMTPMYTMRTHLLSMIIPANLSGEYRRTRALLAAGVCGYKTELVASKLDQICARVGIAHVVSVSGAHVAMICVAIEGITKELSISQHKQKLFSLFCCGIYMLLCGVSPASVRACLLFCVRVGASLFHRKSYAPAAVCLAGLCMLMWDVHLATRIGFMLSMVCVLGISLGADGCTHVVEDAYTLMVQRILKNMGKSLWVSREWYVRFSHLLFSRRMQRFISSFALSLCAYICALPICISVFKEISLIGIIVNVMLVPIIMRYFQVGIILWLLMSVCVCLGIFPFVNMVCGEAGYIFDVWGVFLVRTLACLSEVPFASITCGSYISFCFSCACFLVIGYALKEMKRQIRF